jgi:hypothetical protein
MLTMNAIHRLAGKPILPARRLQLRFRQRGFAPYGAGRRPGVPARIANAHARFEQAAREAMREWLMV